jgi:hypothetical protein
MRCEDCLPLIEEYFDGEVEATVAAVMGAHLSACETCAAALDALSSEQEVYLRYDRGLEVSPDLWSRVSAEIARAPQVEGNHTPRPFLSRVREGFAAALGSLAARPALAASLALLLVAAAAGSLWLSRRSPKVVPAEVAVNVPNVDTTVTPTAPPKDADDGGSNDSATPAGPLNERLGDENPVPADSPRDGARDSAGARGVTITPARAGAADDGEKLLARATAPQANTDAGIVRLRPEGDEVADDTAALFLNASASARDFVADDARPLDPAEKEVARHVEQTQMLLRSIKNAPASGAAAVDFSYEKKLSRRLLDESATLKLEAEMKGDRATRQVLERIEPYLLDIANLRDRPSREEVRSIGERVRKNETLAALQVY